MTALHYDFCVENQSKRKMSPVAGEQFAAEVRKLLRQSGLTQTQLAASLNTSQGTVSRWLSGKQSPSVEHWQIVQKALTGSAAASHDPQPISVTGHIGLYGRIYLVENERESAGKMVTPLIPLPSGIASLEVQGFGMAPRYMDGEVVFYDEEHFPPEAMVGRECIVKVKDGETYLKLVRHGSQPGRFTLVGYSAPDMVDVELEWATPIRFVQRM